MPSTLVPADLGLPRKFTSFRVNQEATVMRIAESEKRFCVLEAPTGVGKSLIYMSLAKLLGGRVLVLTSSKGLQQQLMDDFQSVGMVDMRGQSNYTCIAVDRNGVLKGYGDPGTGTHEGPCRVGVFCPLREEGSCEYYHAESVARKSELVVSNYAYWLTMGRHKDHDTIGHFDLLVLDEAHEAGTWLSEFCTVELDREETGRLLGMDLPRTDESIATWATWARMASIAAKDQYEHVIKALQTAESARGVVKAALIFSRLAKDLGEIAKAGDWEMSEGQARRVEMPGRRTDWIIERTDRGVRFAPVWAHAYAEPYLFRRIPKVVLSSAYIPGNLYNELGIQSKHFERVPVPSTFDPKRRPLIFVKYDLPIRVDRRMTPGQAKLWVSRMDRIIANRLDRKGVIHSRSYQRANQIVEMSKYGAYMITHKPGGIRAALREFRRAEAPCILVSPSVEEGVDFPGDQCRYQIIPKVPFIDGRSPLIKARQKTDKNYSLSLSALALLQQVGRGMRAHDDWCETLIIDDHFKWFRAKVRFPKWFRDAWVTVTEVPDPPELD